MKMQCCFQEESLVLKMKTSNYFHRMKPKCTCGNVLQELVRSRTSKLCVTQNFRLLETVFFLNVIMAKPMTDLCFTCQQNTLKLVWAANLPEEEKSQCVQAWQPHLNSVQTERELYRQVCEKAKCSFEELEDQIDLEESRKLCMLRTTTQVHTPSNPMQPGPI